MRVRFYMTESARAAFDRLCSEHQAEVLGRIDGKIRSVQLLAKKFPEYWMSPACFCVGAEMFVLRYDEEACIWLVRDPDDPDDEPPAAQALKSKKKQRAAAQQVRHPRRKRGTRSALAPYRREIFGDEALSQEPSARETLESERPITSSSDVAERLGARIKATLAAFGVAIHGAAKLITFGAPRSGKTALVLRFPQYQRMQIWTRAKRKIERQILSGQIQPDTTRMLLRTMRSERAPDAIAERERIEARLQQIQSELREATLATERAVTAWLARSASDLWLPADFPRIAAEGGVMDPQPEPGAQRSVLPGDAASEQKEPGRTRNSREEGYFDALFIGPPRNYRGTSRTRIDTSQDEAV